MSCKVDLKQYPLNLFDDGQGTIDSCIKNPNVFLTLAKADGSAPLPTNGKYEPVSDKNVRTGTLYYLVANIANISGRNMLVTSLQFGACDGMLVHGIPTTVISGRPGLIDGPLGQLISPVPVSFENYGNNGLQALIQNWLPKSIPGQNFDVPPANFILPDDQTQQDRNDLKKSALFAQYDLTVHDSSKKLK